MVEQVESFDNIEKQKKINYNKDDEDMLKFMDSLDSYLVSLDSLSSSLRQSWFDFSSARYSMGTSRVNSVLLDLKEHSAATHVDVAIGDAPHFTLCKWVSDEVGDSNNLKDGNNGLQQKLNSMHQRHRDMSQSTEAEEGSSPSGSSVSSVDQVQKERAKSLAVFGTLVSPKLRAAQLSFETALEKVVEIANIQASMVHAFQQLREHKDGTEN